MSTAQAGHRPHERRVARKRSSRRLLAAGSVAAALIAGAIGYGLQTSAPAATGDTLRVVTTTNFLDDTVREIGGNDVETIRLMGPGVDPHLYQPKASDLEAMRDADAVFAVGLYLEGALQQTLDEISRTKPVTFAGEQLDEDTLLTPDADAPEGSDYDPHVWHDPELWAEVIEGLGVELARIDPDNAEAYEERAAQYRDEVLELHEDVAGTLASIPDQHRTLVTSHDAFQYFARAFDIDVATIQGISTEQEASTADIGRVADTVIEAGVPAVFVSSSVPRDTMEAVMETARQQGTDVEFGHQLYSDAAGQDGTDAGTYTGMLRANADRLAEGLS